MAVANELGREVATPAEAKAIMGINIGSKLGVAKQNTELAMQR